MKYFLFIFLIFIVSCSVENNITSTTDNYKEPFNTVKKYCEDYSSHLVPGSKKDNSYQGCVNIYSDDFK